MDSPVCAAVEAGTPFLEKPFTAHHLLRKGVEMLLPPGSRGSAR